MRRLAPLLALALAALAAPPAVAAQRPQGTLLVSVEDRSSGVAIKGARVRLGEDGARAVTDDSGTVRLRGVRAGEQVVYAYLAGYAMGEGKVEVAPGGTHEVVISLEPQLEEVLIEGLNVTSWGRSVVLRGSGFYERKENWNGTFLTRDDIMANRPARLPDLFRAVRGFRIVRVNERDILATTRRPGPGGGYCSPLVYLNGIRIPGSEGDIVGHLGGISPTEVEGIEAYASAAALPPQYTTSDAGCGLILIWTRSARQD